MPAVGSPQVVELERMRDPSSVGVNLSDAELRKTNPESR